MNKERKFHSLKKRNKLKTMGSEKISTECLNKSYSTTKLCCKFIDDGYIDENGKIKEKLKFKINNPEFKIQNSKLIGEPKDKFETLLFLPPHGHRQAEGGLRIKGYFKFNYKFINNRWWIVDQDDKPIKQIALPKYITTRFPSSLPLVTVITAVLNGEKHLEETIKSIINQTYPNIEYIIIDGGSTDGTLDIIKKYESYIDYWVSEPDKGISDAFNKGITVSMGTYINFQGDGDGFYSINSVSRVIENTESAWLISGLIIRISDSEKILFISKPKSKFKKIELLFRMPFPHQGLFTKNSYFKHYGLFDKNITYSMDYEILLRAYKKFPPTKIKNIIVAKWRDDGLGTNKTVQILKEYYMIKKKNKVANDLILRNILLYNLLKFWTQKAGKSLINIIKPTKSKKQT